MSTLDAVRDDDAGDALCLLELGLWFSLSLLLWFGWSSQFGVRCASFKLSTTLPNFSRLAVVTRFSHASSVIPAKAGCRSESFEDLIEAEAVCNEQLADKVVSSSSAEEVKEKIASRGVSFSVTA